MGWALTGLGSLLWLATFERLGSGVVGVLVEERTPSGRAEKEAVMGLGIRLMAVGLQSPEEAWGCPELRPIYYTPCHGLPVNPPFHTPCNVW